MILKEQIGRLRELDSTRTKRPWGCVRAEDGKAWRLIAEAGGRYGRWELATFSGLCESANFNNLVFCMAMPDAVRVIDDLVKRMEEANKALLLAAGWFKLNFDDDTLHEHPPSKADRAGMFDAMQEAREACSLERAAVSTREKE